ncbi:MAG TPA: hypothetical protein VFM18_17335 [Methanosarcina sp.]|nr:hypothetical protein [Methanosarcina sp.]
MLISKSYSAGDVVSFKLVTTEEVVAAIVEVTDEGFKVSRPCTIIPSEMGVGLMQSLLSASINSDILLRKEHVIMHAKTVSEIESHYIRTTTGVHTAAKGGLIT